LFDICYISNYFFEVYDYYLFIHIAVIIIIKFIQVENLIIHLYYLLLIYCYGWWEDSKNKGWYMILYVQAPKEYLYLCFNNKY